MRMKYSLAKIISYITSAPLFAVYLAPIICEREQNWSIAFLMAFLFLLFFPVTPIVLDVKRGRTDIFVVERKKRLKFFILTIISHFSGFLISNILCLNLLSLYFLCYFTVTTAILIITLKWKISVHMAGIAGPVTFLTLIFGPTYVLLFSLLIPTAWARLEMKAHTISQLISGALVAIAVTFITIRAYRIL